MKFTTQSAKKLLRSLSQQLYISEFELPFSQCIGITSSTTACKITRAKTEDGAIKTFPTFERFLSNSRDNVQTLHHTLWRYTFTSDILTQFSFLCIFETNKLPLGPVHTWHFCRVECNWDNRWFASLSFVWIAFDRAEMRRMNRALEVVAYNTIVARESTNSLRLIIYW